ncbi:hypothetical protein [Metapseudomonas furukawaii]|uniref:hypothetical protein n=1 Tax=Metapseudomonas furukawaii TaxID=1149133 RepID=UPI00055E6134|nr:hypothetical protein [Pseudomonas furukawaii]
MGYGLDDRVELLRDMENGAGPTDDFGLLNACVQCLQPGEAASLLSQEAESASRLRNGLLKKVAQDVRASPSLDHYELAERLIARLGKADARGRQGIGYCLSTLLPDLPAEIQRRAQLAFLRSRFVGLRRRGYKAVAADLAPQMDFLREAWATFQDAECAWLLVKLLSPQDLVVMKEEVLPLLSEGWQISRLYLRIAEVDPFAIEELNAVDGIAYSYVLAKLGRSLSIEQAQALITRYETDERLGLLVWSIGQMQLWDALVWLRGRLAEVQQNRHAHLMAKLGA